MSLLYLSKFDNSIICFCILDPIKNYVTCWVSLHMSANLLAKLFSREFSFLRQLIHRVAEYDKALFYQISIFLHVLIWRWHFSYFTQMNNLCFLNGLKARNPTLSRFWHNISDIWICPGANKNVQFAGLRWLSIFFLSVTFFSREYSPCLLICH